MNIYLSIKFAQVTFYKYKKSHPGLSGISFYSFGTSYFVIKKTSLGINSIILIAKKIITVDINAEKMIQCNFFIFFREQI